MANLQSIRGQRNLFGASRSPFDGWVYETNYKMFVCDPDSVPDSRDKFNSVGHRTVNALNPNWIVVRSHTGQVMMLVDGNRWDAGSIKVQMDDLVYQSTEGDTVWTITESTGMWEYNSFDGVTHGTDSSKIVINPTYSYWRSGIVGSVVYEENTEDELREAIQFDISNANPNTLTSGLNGEEEAIWNAWQAFPHNAWNLGNIDDDRATIEFPLDVPISWNNVRMFAIRADAMNSWITDNYGTDSNEENDMDGASDSQLWRAGSPLASVLNVVNPICWTFQLKGSEATAVDQKTDKLIVMTDNATSMEDLWQKLESSIKSNSDNNGPDPYLVVNPFWGYRPA
jgi:hypothetical protein